VPVTSVADLIELLAARRKASILHDRRTGFPYSWSAWLRGWSPARGMAFAGADAAAAAPPWTGPRSRGGTGGLSFRQALLHLFRWGGDDPPPRDQRGVRWFAALCSVALHLLFAVLLVWVALVRSNVPEPGAEEGERVQVEYIGRGTPEDEGGGSPQSAGAQSPSGALAVEGGAVEAAAAPSPPQSMPAAPQDGVASAAPAAMPVDMSRPAPDATAEQPLQVTEVPQPTGDFVLPPPTVEAPAIAAREPQVRERTVATVVERPTPVRPLSTPEVAATEAAMPQVQVRERRIETAPTQPVTMAQVPLRATEVRVERAAPAVRERQIDIAPRQDVAMAAVRARDSSVQLKPAEVAVRERPVPGVADARPAPASGSGSVRESTGGGQTQAAVPAQAVAGSGQAAAASPRSGTSTGAGPRPQDRSGGWAAPTRADDWGASQRQVDGGAGAASDQGRGLFNADGSVRLADGGDRGQVSGERGAPGGQSDTWSREQIDRAGTWLKRPPYEHSPTSFDKYWVPNESLLAEWVRKGIKSIEIPIPGSENSISCVISILQFGGGCGLNNPNMQDQPASARPPPDIPFKKELQDDNGSR